MIKYMQGLKGEKLEVVGVADMERDKIFVIIICCIAALVFCCVGVFCRKTDIFVKLNHPLAKRYPNISKTFGRCMIGIALGILVLFLFFYIFNT